ncbi:hypothetical protein [Priestia megaterium]|uniref:hypothetical protein n=1 Tax=Priestia megaterium TaxID=1404 RepID=UPI00203E67F3|nr:hypothetical protein [Priestia megaterium]MCM3541745.1 hypothetical protein [Priestia megaterium]
MGYLELAKEFKNKKNDDVNTIDIQILSKEQNMVDEGDSPLDKLAHSLGFVVGISNELYFATLSKKSAGKVINLFIEKNEDGWEAREETFIKGKRYAVGVREVYSNRQIKIVFKTVRDYLNSINLVNSP